MIRSSLASALLASSGSLDIAPLIPMGRPIGPGVRRYGNPRSRYMPHQGAREIARRLAKAPTKAVAVKGKAK